MSCCVCVCCAVIIRPHRSTMYVDVTYCYRPSSVVCRSVCHISEPCKNGCTDRDAIWVVKGLGWGPDPHMGRGNFEGKGRPIVKYTAILWSSVQERLNRDAVWVMGRRKRVLDGGSSAPRDIAMATNFGTQFAITGFVGYNFASDTRFYSRGRFSGSSYPMKT